MNQSQKIQKLREQGLSYRKIAKQLGISHSCVQYWLKSDYRDRCKNHSKKLTEKYKTDSAYREKCKEYSKQQRSNFRYRCKKSLYNLGCITNIDKIVESFTGFCECCKTQEINLKRRLAIDHCHKTGKFRGWLCENCNRGLGLLKDDINILKYLIKYLEKENGTLDE